MVLPIERPIEQGPSAPAAITRVMVSADDGRFLTEAALATESHEDGRHNRLVALARPGILASVYFGEGLRRIVIALPDGRRASARISGSTFAAGERAYVLEFERVPRNRKGAA